MENTIVKKEDMLKAKDFNPLNKWHRLNTNNWIHDSGLIRMLQKETGHGEYFVTNKGKKKLWDLITYCGDEDQRLMIKYYDFPEMLAPFIKWVYNHVAADEEWKAKSKEDADQMDFFPYAKLWKIWYEAVSRKKEVPV